VKATKRGEMLGACAQWDELGREWPDAPAVLHNLGACAEARGDMETAQLRYARAAELASRIPLLKYKKARPIFVALERVSGRRMDDTFLDSVTHEPDWPMAEEDEVGS
jgi:Tfp pilus assembly protein PilF